MSNTFMQSPSYLFTSESVTEGHPDKLCDQISDAVLDAILAQDPQARVACETCVTTGLVMVMGEISTTADINVPSIARNAVKEAGYTDPKYGFDYKSCSVITSIDEQSSDISSGVSNALETRKVLESVETDNIGAGDQGMMMGFACNETKELMPLPIYLAHELCKQLAKVRKDGSLGYLGPDGKSQVTVEYEYGIPKRIEAIILSSQHDSDIPQSLISKDLHEKVILPIIPNELLDSKTNYFINPSGRFVIGGPVGDTGLTGRKLLVDTYGAYARHGGGAFSGKDPTKVDRSGAYAARHVAKNIVAAGLADRAEVLLAYAIGVETPVSIAVETFNTNKVPDTEIANLIEKHFDLRPSGIINDLDLRRPIYKQTSTYGHFGRSDIELPWENTSKAAVLKSDSSL
ncbi:MAG: methionine adenosyltransferase [Dehalococcoidia bacterium]